MAEELQQQIQATDRLKIRKKQLEEDNKRLAREVELQQESAKEYAIQQQKRKAQIQRLSERIKELEEDLNKSKQDHLHHQRKLTGIAKKELEDYKLDAEGLRKLLYIRTKELKKIKVINQLDG